MIKLKTMKGRQAKYLPTGEWIRQVAVYPGNNTDTWSNMYDRGVKYMLNKRSQVNKYILYDSIYTKHWTNLSYSERDRDGAEHLGRVRGNLLWWWKCPVSGPQ